MEKEVRFIPADQEYKQKTIKLTGAGAVIKTLAEEGVDTVFGYPGGSIMPVYDAMYQCKDIRHVLCRHEQGAVHAAQGYARATKKTGVCFTTSGPGATNILTGLADAKMDSTPLVIITGQVKSDLLGIDAFQETDIISASWGTSKWNCRIKHAEDIPKILSKAFYLANTGRPGPVLIDITKDAMMELMNFEYSKCLNMPYYSPVTSIDKKKLSKAAEMINAARKPYLFVGQGVVLSGATKEMLKFVDKVKIPVAATMLGLSAIPHDHPLNCGMLGMHGNYAANMNTAQADLILAVGMRFDDRVTGNPEHFISKAKIIHVDNDASELEKIMDTDCPIQADAKEFFYKIHPLVRNKYNHEWIQSFSELKNKEEETVFRKDLYPKTGSVKMGEIIRHISEKASKDRIIVTDVGQHQMKSARYFKFSKPGSFITSGGLGTMGFGLPASIGAQIGRPDTQVIAILGDGGFQMTQQELTTIAQEKIPLKIVVMNNQYLGMVRQWQEIFFEKRYSSTCLQSPDFLKLASANSIPAKRLEHREELEEKTSWLLQEDGPAFLEVMVDPKENVFPMVPPGAPITDMILE